MLVTNPARRGVAALTAPRIVRRPIHGVHLATRLGHIDSEPRQPAPTRASVAATAAAAKAGRKCSTDLIGYLRLAIVPPRHAPALRNRPSLFQARGSSEQRRVGQSCGRT